MAWALALPIAGAILDGPPGRAPRAVAQALSESHVGGELAEFYGERRDRPVWSDGRRLRPDAWRVPALLRGAADDGLRPDDYAPARLEAMLAAARSGDPAALARAELALSQAVVRYGIDLHTPPPEARFYYADPEVAPPALSPRLVMQRLAGAPSLAQGLADLRRMNPIYEGLRQGLATYRAEHPRGAQEALILANLDRARGLPPDLGARYVLVDVPGGALSVHDRDATPEAMKVVVGKLSQPTPMMAGMIRSAVFNPYWNVPPDLVRDRIAPRVLRDGVGTLSAKHLEVLSDWSEDASLVDPLSVDWRAVASGRVELRVRQRPGPDNMMGQVKLMLPNRLGIYLHDTPERWAFAADARQFSSGCVRLERAGDLARLLLGAAWPTTPSPEPEHRVELPRPTPVYITYFTAWPQDGRIVFRRDIYGRDAALMARRS